MRYSYDRLRICGCIRQSDICYSKRSRASCSKLPNSTCTDDNLSIPKKKCSPLPQGDPPGSSWPLSQPNDLDFKGELSFCVF